MPAGRAKRRSYRTLCGGGERRLPQRRKVASLPRLRAREGWRDADQDPL